MTSARKIESGTAGIVLFALCAILVTASVPVWAGPLSSALKSSQASTDSSADLDPSGVEGATSPQEIDKIVAQLSDEQVRRLLLQELQKSGSAEVSGRDAAAGNFVEKVDAFIALAASRIKFVFSNARHIPRELGLRFRQMVAYEGPRILLEKVLVALLILLVAFGLELLLRRRLDLLRDRFKEAPAIGMGDRFVMALLRVLPGLIFLSFFTVVTLGGYALIFGTGRQPVRLIFSAIIITIVFARFLILISQVVCSPRIPELRLMLMSDEAAEELYRVLVRLSWWLSVASVLSLVSRRIFISPDSAIFMVFLFGTFFLGIVAWQVWRYRRPVAQALLDGGGTDEEPSWVKSHLARMWHIFALFYLLLVWSVWAIRLIVYDPHFTGAFYSSLFAVPAFFVLDRIGQWVVTVALGDVLKIVPEDQEGGVSVERPRDSSLSESGKESEDAKKAEGEEDRAVSQVTEIRHEEEEKPSAQPAGSNLVRMSRKIVRVVIFFTVLFWIMGKWGFEFTFGKLLTKAAFDILVVLALALAFWRWFSGYIARKLEESLPEKPVEDEEEEWSTTALGRSHTLLPLLRKFAGSVLAVMVLLLVFSSLGINIGPLLAGAGVVGLAISFGAQKLVADILCGIFYLIDDAFRIGEYIEAGNVSGTVEGMTLRNVVLRHHRGMLQIVPFSDLGPITNFMRGGIVVKFNLKLPYDTDIDKVRKIIKKVGKKMLEDPELGPNFIKPIKSQGVREVGDSALTFRVKFTAKPGTHFLIRREAYKRITEALKAQGIHYAHPKVIVEIPEYQKPPRSESEKTASKPVPDEQQLREMGAAAGLVVQQKKKEEEGKKKESDSFTDL